MDRVVPVLLMPLSYEDKGRDETEEMESTEGGTSKKRLRDSGMFSSFKSFSSFALSNLRKATGSYPPMPSQRGLCLSYSPYVENPRSLVSRE